MNLSIPFQNGTYIREFSSFRDKSHDLGFDLTNIVSGALSIRAKKPGSTFFENIPNGVIDLANPRSVSFTGSVAEFEFTLSSVVGTATVLAITDTSC